MRLRTPVDISPDLSHYASDLRNPANTGIAPEPEISDAVRGFLEMGLRKGVDRGNCVSSYEIV
jgi:hypothetical protein